MDLNRTKVGYAGILQNQELLKCLPNESSINNAEVTAINLAMTIISNHESSKFIIYLNFKSVFQTLQNRYIHFSYHKAPKQNEHSFPK